MAENIENPTTLADGDQTGETEYTGTFYGDLKGTADYAKAWSNAITITVTGDAGGSVSFDGSASKSLDLTVSHATEADTAAHADTADTVTSAQTAVSANYATTAGHANTADSATTATNAEYATAAGTATSAGSATSATEASHATKADEADHATQADTATTAATADVANALADGVFVPNAEYATKAGTATYALYDCEGYAFNLVYAKKKDVVLKEDAFTKEQADALYVPITEKIVQASVYGKAAGTGLVVGNTLQIHITGLSVGDGGTFYGSLETGEFDEDDADTTKVYLTDDGYFYVWVDEQNKWQQVLAPLTEEAEQQLSSMQEQITAAQEQIDTEVERIQEEVDEQEEKLNAGLEKLEGVVTLTDEQTISGKKTFEQIVYAGIPDLEQDDGHAVMTVHNAKDIVTESNAVAAELKVQVLEMKDEIDAELQDITARLNAQDIGNLIISFKDLSQPENQQDMVPGTYYLNYLTEDGTYIQLDPDTGVPADSSQDPFYKRFYLKDDRGNVTYSTYRIEVDLSGYAQLAGAVFTGNIQVPDVDVDTSDNVVMNSRVVHTLVDQEIEKLNQSVTDTLEEYARLDGADYTGAVTVPAQNDLTAAADTAVLNKGDISTLLAAKPSLFFVTEAPDFSDGSRATGIYLVTA